MTFVINITYDSSVTDLDNPGNAAYDPTLYTEYTGAVRTAVQYYENEFTTPITVNISFGWGEAAGYPVGAGALGASSTYSENYTYADVLAAAKTTETTSLVQRAAVLTLPATDPTGGATFSIATAEARALGLDATYNGTDGSAGLNSTDKFSWTQTNVASGTYDAVGTVEHEISEVLGRVDDAGIQNQYTLMDMFRYTAANGLSGDEPGSAVGERDEPFVAGYSATAAASAQAGVNSYSYFSYDGSTITLQYDVPSRVAQGADVADWSDLIAGDSYGYGDPGTAGPVSTTDLEAMNVLGYDLACYLPDTQIATPSGEVSVQNLAVGDRVMTHRGSVASVVWIGRGKALATRGRRCPTTPIIIRKGAISDNVPNRDLRITKGHALYFDNVLIPVEFLVNHRSIAWDDRAQEVTVYHVELATHDVLMANGAPAESYRDDGNRWLFHNHNTGWHLPPKLPCAPVLTGGPIVDAVWKRLLDRSGARPFLPLTDDPDLHLLVDGRRLDGRAFPNGVHAFRVPGRPHDDVRIVSRGGAQDELGLARDPRMLGVALQRIILWWGRHPTVIEADNPLLSQGFHAYEPANRFRWTNGNAVLPVALFERPGCITGFDLKVASTTWYPLLGDAVPAAA